MAPRYCAFRPPDKPVPVQDSPRHAARGSTLAAGRERAGPYESGLLSRGSVLPEVEAGSILTDRTGLPVKVGGIGAWVSERGGDLDSTLTVLLYAGLAAGTSAFGVLPLASGRPVPVRMIGWANALASGLMLGVAYALMATGMTGHPLEAGAGAVMGLLFVRLTHAATGTAELELNRLDEARPEYGYQVILVNTLHSAHEGVAIGIAMAVSLSFGILMALALAVHNIPEATILCSVVKRRGVRLREAAVLAVATNSSQVLLAVVTFAVVQAAPAITPWVVGFAVGALIYLVLVELLPESYREAGHTSIAVVTVVAMGIVVLLNGQAG